MNKTCVALGDESITVTGTDLIKVLEAAMVELRNVEVGTKFEGAFFVQSQLYDQGNVDHYRLGFRFFPGAIKVEVGKTYVVDDSGYHHYETN